MILHYWYLAPSFCIVLATIYFAYRVLLGYVNTPEKALAGVIRERREYVLGRINQNRVMAFSPKESAENAFDEDYYYWMLENVYGLNVEREPISGGDKGTASLPKELDENPLEVKRLTLAPSKPQPVIVDKSCNVEGVWIFEKWKNDDTWHCLRGEDIGGVGSGYVDMTLIIAHFHKHKYTWERQDMLSGEHLLTIKSRKDYFDEFRCSHYITECK